jgi:hypothetical protein
MGIRLPMQTVKVADDSGNVGAGSVAGQASYPFIIPQDTDNVLVKMTASISGGGVSAVFQTSDDGGTTYYDVARTSIVSNANNTTAEWLNIPVISPGIRTGVTFGGASIISAGIGRSGASTLAAGQVSGLPVMGQQNRIGFIYTGTITASSLVQAQVKVNSQTKA